MTIDGQSPFQGDSLNGDPRGYVCDAVTEHKRLIQGSPSGKSLQSREKGSEAKAPGVSEARGLSANGEAENTWQPGSLLGHLLQT